MDCKGKTVWIGSKKERKNVNDEEYPSTVEGRSDSATLTAAFGLVELRSPKGYNKPLADSPLTVLNVNKVGSLKVVEKPECVGKRLPSPYYSIPPSSPSRNHSSASYRPEFSSSYSSTSSSCYSSRRYTACNKSALCKQNNQHRRQLRSHIPQVSKDELDPTSHGERINTGSASVSSDEDCKAPMSKAGRALLQKPRKTGVSKSLVHRHSVQLSKKRGGARKPKSEERRQRIEHTKNARDIMSWSEYPRLKDGHIRHPEVGYMIHPSYFEQRRHITLCPYRPSSSSCKHEPLCKDVRSLMAARAYMENRDELSYRDVEAVWGVSRSTVQRQTTKLGRLPQKKREQLYHCIGWSFQPTTRRFLDWWWVVLRDAHAVLAILYKFIFVEVNIPACWDLYVGDVVVGRRCIFLFFHLSCNKSWADLWTTHRCVGSTERSRTSWMYWRVRNRHSIFLH